MKRGFFIVIEGLDGSGKSLQSRLLAEYLKNKNLDVILTFEPTNEKIGRLLTNHYLKEVDLPIADALLFAADREEHLKTLILPALDEGKIVISDRYWHSSFAYQNTQGLDLNWLKELNKFFIKPDLTIFIDVSPEECVKRIEKDIKRKIEDRKKFEKLEFLTKLRNNYLKLPNILKDEKIVIVDGNRQIEKIHRDIVSEVENLIKS